MRTERGNISFNVTRNRPGPQFSAALRAQLRVLQLVIGVGLLAIGWLIGRNEIEILRHGESAVGRVVAYQQLRNKNTSSSHAVVEYTANGSVVRFVDRFSARSDPAVGGSVRVLYVAAPKPSSMIDRGWLNWIPWGIMVAMGAIVTLSAGVGLLRMIVGI